MRREGLAAAAVERLLGAAVPTRQKSRPQIPVTGPFLQGGSDGIVHIVTVTRAQFWPP